MFANMMPLPSMTTATEIVFNRGLELLVPGAWDNVVCRVLIGQGHCMFLNWTIQWPEQLYVCVSNTIPSMPEMITEVHKRLILEICDP